jgi:hypothetical protein
MRETKKTWRKMAENSINEWDLNSTQMSGIATR